MGLDVDAPEPPDLSNRGRPIDFEWQEETLGTEDFHREDLEQLLQDGAWRDGFEEWGDFTELDDAQVQTIEDFGLFQEFDFFWDPTDDRIRFHAPSMPEDWRSRDALVAFDSGMVSMIDNELQDLGRTVQESLEKYLDRSEETSTHTWGEEAFGERSE